MLQARLSILHYQTKKLEIQRGLKNGVKGTTSNDTVES